MSQKQWPWSRRMDCERGIEKVDDKSCRRDKCYIRFNVDRGCQVLNRREEEIATQYSCSSLQTPDHRCSIVGDRDGSLWINIFIRPTADGLGNEQVEQYETSIWNLGTPYTYFVRCRPPDLGYLSRNLSRFALWALDIEQKTNRQMSDAGPCSKRPSRNQISTIILGLCLILYHHYHIGGRAGAGISYAVLLD